jgi:hypothetical protein
MRVDRGAGCVRRPVNPVGVPGSMVPRTAAKRRSAGLIVGVQLGDCCGGGGGGFGRVDDAGL